MERLSVNGVLLPIDNNILIDSNNQPIKDPYIGHFMQVIYIQEIAGQNVFGKDRVEVEEGGQFRFFIPTNLADNEMVTIEIYAPDGEMLGEQRYSSGSLNSSAISVSTKDSTKALEIVVNPKIIVFNVDSPTIATTKTIRGKVIDLSGEQQASNLQVIIFISSVDNAIFDIDTFDILFATNTDINGYFTAKIDNTKSIKSAFGLIAGLESNPIQLKPKNNELPKDILLVTDLTDLSDDLITIDTVPTLPDSDELATSSAFSQDLGGTCVDFTIPNRTLEEFSFYHTVRTTEPEIKGLTITPNDGRKIADVLNTVSNNAFIVFTRLNTSFKSLNMHQFSAEEEQAEFASNMPSESTGKNLNQTNIPVKNTIALKFSEINITKSINISANLNRFILPDVNKVTITLEQARRRTKLHELQQKLTAAYCGLKGVSEAKTYCEELASNDTLNREEISSLLGHLIKNKDLLEMDTALSKEFDNTLFGVEKFINLQNVDDKGLNVIAKKLEKILKDIDTKTKESQAQENLLAYLKRIIIELSRAKGGNRLAFKPCPPSEKSDTMGIICLMQEFEKIKATLKNTSILSLGEIIEIEEYYTIFLTSLRTFLTLLEEFYSFYNSSVRLSTVLVDNYFIEEYDNIKNTLGSLNKQIHMALTSISNIKRAYIENHPGRAQLSVERSIDWDETPTVYENTTIAHGHILHFKQKWKADGYSLGTLLYSLPLGPCQEKQIAILDWDRKENASRTEAQDVSEQLQADISRNRDITDIINASLHESINASSSNETSSTSAGIGTGIGGFFTLGMFSLAGGIAGGVSHSGASSHSNASQDSARNLASNSLNSLRDNTSQSASSLRSQRSTVIQTVGQNESVSAQTEVIKNNNHCHAMTIEYFEVLRHYALEEELVDAQECLYVPLPMSHFDHKKILRWKDTLRRSIYGRKLHRGFDAIERIEANYANSDLPNGSYADEVIEEFTGHFDISFELRRPNIPEIDEATNTIRYNLILDFPWYLGGSGMVIPFNKDVPLSESEKDAIFEKDYAPDIVRTFIDTLDIFVIADNGGEEKLDLDVTLLSSYRRGSPLKVSLSSNSKQDITRNQIKHIRFRANTSVKASSKIILRSVYLHYRTKHLNEYIIRNNRVNNDIINTVETEIEVGFPPIINIETKTDAALLYSPLNKNELRNPKQEDREAASALVDFLNEHLEKSHKIIWSRMDNSRLFGLLDGYIAPNAKGRSVASVVENKIMGIVGNNLVLKVIPGERLDPVFRAVENLLEYYKPTTKPDPYRISVPTKGVYAESVMGKCNSCEEIDETKHWRFDDEPCGTKPTAIDPLSTSSRQSDPGNLQPKDLPTNLINLQNAPAAPDPTGLATALGILGQGDIFKDLTGLSGTQANALGALQTTSKSVTDLVGLSKDFANLAVLGNAKTDGTKQIEQIKKLNKDGYLNDDETNQEIKKVLDTYNNAAKSVNKNQEDSNESTAKKLANKVIETGLNSPNQEIDYQKINSEGETESITIKSPTTSANDSPSPEILLIGATSSPELRAFNPSSNDKSLIIEVSATLQNAPTGAKINWSTSDPTALTVDNPDMNVTRVRGLKPGKHDLIVQMLDSGGNNITQTTVKLSVPQCVTVNEDTTLFDAALTDIHLDGQKNAVMSEVQSVVEHLMRNTNVRVFWQQSDFSEIIPSHIDAVNVISATIKNKDLVNGYLGVTFGTQNGDIFNERIEIFPGMYAEDDAIDVDTETQALIIELETSLGGDASLIPTMIKVYGRLIGETLSHEIGHALLWDDLSPNRHNNPAIANDLMNGGVERVFKQRTGLENIAQVSPVEPEHYIDHGLSAIGDFQAVNQGLIDNQWPVPPAHL